MGRWIICGKVDMQEKQSSSSVDVCGNGGYALTHALTHMNMLTKYRLTCVYK